MKKTILFLAIAFAFSSFGFSQNELKYDAKIQKVTVFQTQAQVEKYITIPLKQGNNEVILIGNSAYMNTQSLQFQTSGDFVIMDFAPYIQYVQPVYTTEDKLPLDIRKRLKSLRDSVEDLNYKYSEISTLSAILNQERNALSSMKVITQPQTIDSLPKLKDGLAYYREKMLEVTSLLQKKNKEMIKINLQISELNNQINLILQGENKPQIQRNEYYIKLNIYAETALPQARLEYDYLVSNVSWEPIYDVKFTKPTDPARFILKANLSQSTDEDWNDVKLVFSTEQPNNRKALGVLYPYYLNPIVQRPVKNIHAKRAQSKQKDTQEDMGAAEYSDAVFATNNSAYTQYTTTELTMLGKEYEVGMKHTVLADGKVKIIPLETKKTKADYKHYSIPKIEKAVYISALLPDWEELEVMDAQGKIYLENNYINDTYLSSAYTLDTLNLPIGQDRRVVVDRKITKSKPEKTSIIGNEVETIVTITLTVKNNNQTKIDLGLEDQIPLSNKDNIKITANNTAKAKYDDKTGQLVWDLTLNSLETKTIVFSYTVRYPKGSNIILN